MLALITALLAGILSAGTLTWVPPDGRMDGTPLSADEIAGYRIYCGGEEVSGLVTGTSWTVAGLPEGEHTCTARTEDTDGRLSVHSEPVVVELGGVIQLPALAPASQFRVVASWRGSEEAELMPTQFFFQASDPGILDEFTRLYGSGSLSIISDDGSPALRIDEFNSWFSLDVIGQVSDVEIASEMRVETTASNERAGIFARGDDSGDNYASFASVTSNTRMVIFEGGARSTLTNNSFSGHDNTLYHTRRFRLSGNSLQHKTWQEGVGAGRETVAWTASTTNSVYAGPGHVGIQNWADSGATFRWFSVGLDGDPAPTGPQQQYHWTAEDYDVNDVPDDAWAAGNRVSGFTIQEDGDGRKYIDVTRSGGGLAILRFLPAGALGPDTEILMEFEGAEGQIAAFIRGSGLTTEGSETFHSARYVRFDGVLDADQTVRYLNGSPTTNGSNNFPTGSVDRGDRGFVRLRMNGNGVQARYWKASDPEPTNWQLGNNDSNVYTDGETGIAFIVNELKVYSFSVGGNGWVAPDAPLDPDPPGDQVLPDDAAHHQASDSPALAEAASLEPAGSSHGVVSDAPSLAGALILEASDASHEQSAAAVSLSAAMEVQPASSAHAQSATAPDLSQATVLTVASSEHAHATASPPISQAASLSAADAVHSHAAGVASLAESSALGVEASDQAQTSSGTILSQAAQLAVLDALQVHTSGQAALTESVVLGVEGSDQAHWATAVTLGLAGLINAHDVIHGHSAGAPLLTQAHVIAVHGVEHQHQSDSATTTLALVLQPLDTDHSQASTPAPLTAADMLAVQDAVHAHDSLSAELMEDALLVVSDALHAHLSSQVPWPDGVFRAGRLLLVQAHERLLVADDHVRLVIVAPTDRFLMVKQ
ncbi:MAG: hypothetical protein JJU06_05835 [Ectothiorhodospiraceae bacterium]|nr:hypothetical protein [Ectothiorhodospiraceae bacterium]MCH8502904.1 hypothetical protein [Ectothiorhodospiraceae bacterium]